jgi:hypothetical protein
MHKEKESRKRNGVFNGHANQEKKNREKTVYNDLSQNMAFSVSFILRQAPFVHNLSDVVKVRKHGPSRKTTPALDQNDQHPRLHVEKVGISQRDTVNHCSFDMSCPVSPTSRST